MSVSQSELECILQETDEFLTLRDIQTIFAYAGKAVTTSQISSKMVRLRKRTERPIPERKMIDRNGVLLWAYRLAPYKPYPQVDKTLLTNLSFPQNGKVSPAYSINYKLTHPRFVGFLFGSSQITAGAS